MYIKDLQTGKIFGLDGATGDTVLSADGTYLMSTAGNSSLYAPATNGVNNAFVAYNPLIEQNSLSRLTWFDLKTQAGAQEALDWFKEYAREIERVGSTVGASLSRFNSATNTLGSMSENFRAAESRIVDADMAVLSAEAVRISIIQEAATAVLAQANQQPSLVLDLLEGT